MVKTDMEKQQRKDDEFAARVGKQLRNSADELDAATLSRLNQSRQVALDGGNFSASSKQRRNQWLPVGVAAALAVIVVTLWPGQVPEPQDAASLSIVDAAVDMELLFDDGDLEMYEELEFFAWLSEEQLENIG